MRLCRVQTAGTKYLCSACTGGHRVVRLRVVAPASAVQQSTSESASCHWATSSMSKAPAASLHMRADAVEPSSERAHHGAMQVSCMLLKDCLATHFLGILCPDICSCLWAVVQSAYRQHLSWAATACGVHLRTIVTAHQACAWWERT